MEEEEQRAPWEKLEMLRGKDEDRYEVREGRHFLPLLPNRAEAEAAGISWSAVCASYRGDSRGA